MNYYVFFIQFNDGTGSRKPVMSSSNLQAWVSVLGPEFKDVKSVKLEEIFTREELNEKRN
jgi:hypothetical protein